MYVAFVVDVLSRRIVGWQVSTRLYTALAIDALEMGIWTRRRDGADLSGLVHHSDRGVQYRAVRYAQRLAVEDAVGLTVLSLLLGVAGRRDREYNEDGVLPFIW